ncbi:hypothetical protein ACJX0J_006117, partial [Zea mays]
NYILHEERILKNIISLAAGYSMNSKKEVKIIISIIECLYSQSQFLLEDAHNQIQYPHVHSQTSLTCHNIFLIGILNLECAVRPPGNMDAAIPEQVVPYIGRKVPVAFESPLFSHASLKYSGKSLYNNYSTAYLVNGIGQASTFMWQPYEGATQYKIIINSARIIFWLTGLEYHKKQLNHSSIRNVPLSK